MFIQLLQSTFRPVDQSSRREVEHEEEGHKQSARSAEVSGFRRIQSPKRKNYNERTRDLNDRGTIGVVWVHIVPHKLFFRQWSELGDSTIAKRIRHNMVERLDFEHPTPLQSQLIPLIYSGPSLPTKSRQSNNSFQDTT